jgi:hypothetical protein
MFFTENVSNVEYRSHLLVEVTDEAQNENKKVKGTWVLLQTPNKPAFCKVVAEA